MARRIHRRMFLQGAAGFTLAIPFLPSVMEREAEAAPPGTKRFIAFGTEHGALRQSSMCPADATLTETMSYAGHEVRRGPLTAELDAEMARISPVLSAAAGALSPSIVAKLNVLRGLDIPFYIGHHRGGHLGNYAENNGDEADPAYMQQFPRPTIDQVMAWSPSFYPNLDTTLRRSIHLGGSGMSAGWSSPSTGSGEVQNMATEVSNVALFHEIYMPPDEDLEQARVPIVDRVLEDYRRLRDGNRRLSREDRRRLSDHLDRLDELERRLGVVGSCGELMPPSVEAANLLNDASSYGDVTAQVQYWQLMNDVIVTALACDTCRVVTAALDERTKMSDYTGDWHQDVAHKADYAEWAQPPSASGPHPHDYLVDANQRFFEDVFLDLVNKLDAVDEPDGTLLDGCLVQWSQESGPATHEAMEMPLVTAGSAAGFFRTGQYCDYRNLDAPWREPEQIVSTHRGLIYNQWLGTALQSMGLSPGEYETGERGGYGEAFFGNNGWFEPSYASGVLNAMGDLLPFIEA